MTLFSVFQNGFKFALDAGEMGTGKTYTALGLIRTLGLNFGVVCPANLVSKWTDTAIDAFDVEPEFVLSYDKARLGKHDQFVSRHHLGTKSSHFRWNCFEPVVLIFDEVQGCAAPDSLNAALLQAAITNPHAIAVGLSGTAANNPVEMKVLGHALGCHDGQGWWRWAKANGCYENQFGGLQFTENRQRSIIFLSAIHSHIFPNRGCRILKSDLKEAGKVPVHEVFTSSVDAPDAYPKWLEPYVAEAEQAKEDDGDESLPITQQLRARMLDELALIPHVISQAHEALDEEQSVAIFACFEATLKALHEGLETRHPMYYKGSTSKATKADNLRAFQSNTKKLLLINVEAGAVGIDLHDISGLHPRYSIIFPTYKARTYLQAIDRTDRLGKLSVSSVELPFLTRGVHVKIMKSVQRKIDNLSLLNDGELSGMNLSGEGNV